MRFDGKKYHELFHAEETEAAQKTVSGEIVKPDPKKTEETKAPEETKPAEEPQEENITDPTEEPQEEPEEVKEDGNN